MNGGASNHLTNREKRGTRVVLVYEYLLRKGINPPNPQAHVQSKLGERELVALQREEEKNGYEDEGEISITSTYTVYRFVDQQTCSIDHEFDKSITRDGAFLEHQLPRDVVDDFFSER